ncbi:MgtC/SapB family protein [Psychrilyobacter atlanticus]|uniref:MgtC/SapB family protein n=1 Tax=Psychrilyobacter atlanticus TaxID=271091 RepID=UPI000419C229|nr:MgtC/SapB family protein [Psychrilyobacter atlanticus]
MEMIMTLYGMSLYEFMLRVFIACVVGALFGLERKSRGKPAGMKTNMLACAGAAIVSVIQLMISNKTAEAGLNIGNVKADPTRLTAQVISGLGFLGAGVIMTGGDKVRGLTTAATLWLVAILGIGIGYGFYPFILPASAMILLLSYLMKKIETTFIEKRKIKKVILEYEQSDDLESIIKEIAKEKDIKIVVDKKISEIDDGERILIKKVMHFSLPKYVSSKYFFNIIRKFEEVISVTRIN